MARTLLRQVAAVDRERVPGDRTLNEYTLARPTPIQGADVRVTGLSTNLAVADIERARGFYADYLGLSVEAFNLGWVARLRSPDGRAHVQLVTRDATSPEDSVISVHVGNDVDEAYAEAQRRGYEIVHPLTDEPWGVRRFLVRAPDGNVVNVVSHSDD